jgi:outer membrane protein assembly factor BamB
MKKFIPILLLIVISCSKKNDHPDTTNNISNGEFGTILDLNPFGDSVRMVNATTGQIISSAPSLLVQRGNGLSVTDDSNYYEVGNTSMYSLKLRNGSWNYFYADLIAYVRFKEIYSFPVLDNNFLYYSRMDPGGGYTDLYCQNKYDGTVVWSSKIYLGSDGMDTIFYPTPVISGNKVIVNKYVFNYGPVCFDKNTGKILWTNYKNSYYNLNNFPFVYQDQKLFISSKRDQKLYCLDVNTGTELWNVTLDKFPVNAEMRVINDQLFVMVGDKTNTYFYFLDINNGSVIKKSAPITDNDYYLVGFEYPYVYLRNMQSTNIKKIDLFSSATSYSIDFPTVGGFTGSTGSLGRAGVTDKYIYCTTLTADIDLKYFKIFDKMNGKLVHEVKLAYKTVPFGFLYLDKSGKPATLGFTYKMQPMY